MIFKRNYLATAGHLSRKRISRSLATILTLTLLQVALPSQLPTAYAAAGNVGSSTSSGTCASAVGETTYVTATFEVNTFCLLKFTTGTTWTVPTGVTAIDILVVGGGGGGGTDGGGGGGGGEVRQATGVSVAGGVSGTATVGLGGAGGSWTAGTGSYSGNTTSFVINGTTYSAGGGAGGVGWLSSENYAAAGSGGQNGTQLTGSTNYSKGGRNAVQISGPSSITANSPGYAGVTTSFTGTSLTFVGGGGGGLCTDVKGDASFGGAAGGTGGGGRGAYHTQNVGFDAGQPGTNSLGGGGGGGGACNGGGTNGVNGRTAGGRGGDGVVYIKYIPVISITSNPSNATGIIGSTTTFTAATLGTISGATRTKKWQVLVPGGSWTDIPSSNADSYTTPTFTRDMNGNQYRYVVTDAAGTLVSTSNSSAATLTVTAPYLLGDTDTALTTTGTKYVSASNSTTIIPGTVSTMSIEAWVKPSSTCDLAAPCTIAAVENSYLIQIYSGKIIYYIGSGSAYCDGGGGKFPADTQVTSGRWSHVALVRNGVNVKIYINGQIRSTIDSSCSPATQAANSNPLYLGVRSNNYQALVGSLDEVRIWNTDRSASVSADMNSNETSTAGLLNYWNFNEGTGTTTYNQVPGAGIASDLTITDSTIWDADVVSSLSNIDPYATRTFYRTYITANGGWRIPSTVNSLSALIVGGGGGGGYNSGGGGSGGGVLTQGRLVLSGVQAVTVGVGGVGASSTGGAATVGGNSKFASTTVQGGNPGGNYPASQAGGTAITTASGTSGAGGAGAPSNITSGTAGGAGISSDVTTPSQTFGGGGGGGGWTASTGGGAGGNGGGGAGGITNSQAGKFGGANTGGGGGGGSASGTIGGFGGSGVVVVRWITASKPIFTQPTYDTTTAGLIDTITVSADPISPLTRSYRWQSSTDTGTTWSNISTGSGFTSQTYSTPTLETNTSGARYQYRVIVTDSDTVGLSIVDTSTAVYLTINPRISISGSYTTQKYGATHTDTFTAVTGTGTGNKTFTFTPNNRSGITWNSATANQATLTLARTLGPGTYYETMTATDTKGATNQYAIAIVVGKADTITVTSLARTDTYTGSALSFAPGYTITGLQNSDTVTSISWSYTGTENSASSFGPSTTKPVNAGSYQITPTAVISNSDSYTAVAYETSTLTINRATRTITGSISPSPLKFGSTGALSSTPSAGAGDGAVSYVTSTTDSCTVSSANLQAMKSTGSCAFTARIARGNNYESATSTLVSVNLIKADTLTVSVDAIAPVTYTGSPAAVSPTVTVTGLVSSNSISSNPVTINYVGLGASGSSCAQGGACAVGDTGPGGGKVFYVAATEQSWGRYLEAAPANWSGGADNQASNVTKWCEASPTIDGTTLSGFWNGLGLGYDNTYDTRLNVCTGGAIYNARAYRGGGFTDWYVPNNTELALMADSSVRTMIGLVNDLAKWGYWGSYQAADTGYIGSLVTSSWAIGATIKSESGKNYMRPIRAFSDGEVAIATYSSPPTDAGTYTVKASSLALTSGSLSDYQGVIYTDSSLLINRAQQLPLNIFMYGGTVGSPYLIVLQGGGGTGVVTETLTGTSSLTGCAVNNHYLTATEQKQGFCEVRVVKAGDRNYFSETQTVQLYFMAYLNNQPTGITGSGSTIALNGGTSLETSTIQAPSITGLSATTISLAGGGTFTITGTGFSGAITVKFWRNKTVSVTSSNGTSIDIPVSTIASIGATSGRIAVITAAGEGISVNSLTITP
ncbi:Concanavalin A-like lectin/glucanases superfamily [Candidatus Nanopelagicaceae bacterium]